MSKEPSGKRRNDTSNGDDDDNVGTDTDIATVVVAATMMSTKMATAGTTTYQPFNNPNQNSTTPFILPNGEIMDSKNTLQSFVVPVVSQPTPMSSSAAASVVTGDTANTKATDALTASTSAMTYNQNPPFLLPNGEVMNSKNTLQSFVVAPQQRTAEVTSSSETAVEKVVAVGATKRPTGAVAATSPLVDGQRLDGGGIHPLKHVDTRPPGRNHSSNYNAANVIYRDNEENIDGNDPNHNPSATDVQAVAVHSVALVVEAEVVDSLFLREDPQQRRTLPTKRIWILAISFVVVVSGISAAAGYCGSGKCSSSPKAPSKTIISISPATGSPIMVPFDIPSSSPIATPSTSPSVFPSALRSLAASKMEVMTTFINNITLSGRTLSIDGTTAEDTALRWIIDNDPMYNTSNSWSSFTEGSTTMTKEKLRLRQRYSLLTLWFQQPHIGGNVQQSWTSATGWTTSIDECNWYGIQCLRDDVDGDKVIGLDFFNETSATGNNVTGTIPADLGLLQYLQRVDFAFNALTGTLPSTIRLWIGLQYFSVAQNLLTGPLIVGQWTILQHFSVWNNLLAGTLPSAIGNWTALTFFDIDQNALTGTIPASIEKWSGLTNFYASGNKIRGTFPSAFGSLTALTALGANENVLMGTLPSNIGKLTLLMYFSVESNFLSGTLPSNIGLWPLLAQFGVSNNSMNGTIPTEIGDWNNLDKGYFQRNQFTGTMPTGICDAPLSKLCVDFEEVKNCTCCSVDCV